MSLHLGDVAPNLSATTTEGTNEFHHWLGNSWGVLFSHPADFTPVCTTELGTVARIKGEFEKRNVKVIAVSLDPLESHNGWIRDINETQVCTMNFPVIADETRQVATAYDMIHSNVDDKTTVRFQEMVRRSRIQTVCSHPPRRAIQCGSGLQVNDFSSNPTPIPT